MLINTSDYEKKANCALPRFVFDYLRGGAEDEQTLRLNIQDLAKVRLMPNCLAGNAHIDLSVELFGERWSAPFAVAPIGLCGLVRPRGDAMLARAAARARIPHILSTASNTLIEDLHEADAPALQWLQLYVLSDRLFAERLLKRAKAARFGALVLTVDVPVSGARERDARNAFRLPFRVTPSLALDVLRRPGWLSRLARGGSPQFVNLVPEGKAGDAQAQAALLAREMDRTLDWSSLQWVRKHWDGPLLLKGILHPKDAQRALSQGVDAIVVSNHGGRQFDGAPSSISALPGVIDAVEGRKPVLVDGGFRRGTDVLKALALGAHGVLLGRAPVYGLAADGEQGVDAVLAMLRQELERAAALLGVTAMGDVGRNHLAPAEWLP
ncbi:alpha-hydroxy acid oxidase [Variovorax sp. KK3]|uniref:alpha-hydroxy acid oxidase n=1 Tax=Variovorax sp. KK3 TaxID=1855728 RepID=UPI00097C52E1|nr:alpha-hydroxy acid oxidase [Variovorax sp. KK3]